MPYLAGRALNMHRYPNGAQTKGFWHKELPDHAPEWLARWTNPEADPGETRTYLVVDEPAALVWAANFGALEWHAWTRGPTRRTAARTPSSTSTPATRRAGTTCSCWPGCTEPPSSTSASGPREGHRPAWHPDLDTDHARPQLRQTRAPGWRSCPKTVGRVVPELVSWKWQVTERGGLARLDYTQNAINKTLVAPYSPRPAPGAPVSAPIAWDELDDPALRPDRFTVRTMPQRLAERGDLFAGLRSSAQHLPPL